MCRQELFQKTLFCSIIKYVKLIPLSTPSPVKQNKAKTQNLQYFSSSIQSLMVHKQEDTARVIHWARVRNRNRDGETLKIAAS